MGCAVFPSCCLVWGQTIVGVKMGDGDLLPKDLCRHSCIQCPWPCSRPLLTQGSAKDFWTLTGKSGSYQHMNWIELKSLSHVGLFASPWSVAHQAPPSMGFFRQEFWSGLPFPSPGDLPDPGIEPRSPALRADALTSEPPGKPVPT